MKKKNGTNTFSFFLFFVTIAFSILSYGLIQIFYKWEEWVINKSSNFNPLQIILDTIKLHWFSFLLWNIIIIVSVMIIQKSFRKYSANEEKLRYVLNSAIDGILLINENGEIMGSNPAAEKIFGFTESELLGQNISLLMPEPYKVEHASYIKNYLKTGKAKIIGIGRETVGKRKNGLIFPIDLAVSEIIINNQRLFTGIVRDITLRKQLENKLEIQYHRQMALSEFDLAINQSHELQKMIDHVVRAIRDFLPASGGASMFLWKNNEEIPFMYSINMNESEKTEAIKLYYFNAKFFQKITEKCRPVIVDEIKQSKSQFHKLLLNNGIHSYAEIPLYAEDKAQGILCAFDKNLRKYSREDIDYLLALANRTAISIAKVYLYEDLRYTNRSLQNQKGEMQSLLDSTEEAISFVSPEMQFITINRKFAELFGLDSDDIDSYQLQTFLSQIKKIFKDPELVFSRINEAVNNSPKQYLDSLAQIWPVQRELELFSNPVQTSNEEYLGRLFVFRDVTYDREVDRMKTEFVSTVSHELRTPLTSIHGSLGLINGGVAGELSEQAKILVDIAYKNSERLIRLINDILDVEKIRSDRMVFDNKAIDLIPLIKQSIRLNSGYGDQFGVKFQMIDSIAEGIVFADGDRLMQVLTNLLSNAAKFSPRDSTVDISVTRQKHQLKVSVIDHGPGISKAFRKRIFQRFSQGDASTTRKKGGTGLGLSINKAIVEKLNGEIGYKTKINLGTTFFFTLPEWKE